MIKKTFVHRWQFTFLAQNPHELIDTDNFL